MFIQRPPTLSLPTQGEGNADARNGPALVHRSPFAHRPPLLSSPTSGGGKADARARATREGSIGGPAAEPCYHEAPHELRPGSAPLARAANRRGSLRPRPGAVSSRSEEHTSELLSRENLVCR